MAAVSTMMLTSSAASQAIGPSRCRTSAAAASSGLAGSPGSGGAAGGGGRPGAAPPSVKTVLRGTVVVANNFGGASCPTPGARVST